jgi:hypothetical protein
MIYIGKLEKMTYGEALLCNEVRNCGLYFVYYKDKLLYIGKVSSETLKRRLAEHVSYDNGFNLLTRKISKYKKMPLAKTEDIFRFIIDELRFSVYPVKVHKYKRNGDPFFVKESSDKIKELEKELVKKYHPPLNKRNVIPEDQ